MKRYLFLVIRIGQEIASRALKTVFTQNAVDRRHDYTGVATKLLVKFCIPKKNQKNKSIPLFSSNISTRYTTKPYFSKNYNDIQYTFFIFLYNTHFLSFPIDKNSLLCYTVFSLKSYQRLTGCYDKVVNRKSSDDPRGRYLFI